MSSKGIVRSLVAAVIIGTVGLVLAGSVACGGGLTNPGLVPDTTTQNPGEPPGVAGVLPTEVREALSA